MKSPTSSPLPRPIDRGDSAKLESQSTYTTSFWSRTKARTESEQEYVEDMGVHLVAEPETALDIVIRQSVSTFLLFLFGAGSMVVRVYVTLRVMTCFTPTSCGVATGFWSSFASLGEGQAKDGIALKGDCTAE